MSVPPPPPPSRTPVLLVAGTAAIVGALITVIVFIAFGGDDTPVALETTTSAEATTEATMSSPVAGTSEPEVVSPTDEGSADPTVAEPPSEPAEGGDDPGSGETGASFGTIAPGPCLTAPPIEPLPAFTWSEIPSDMDGDGFEDRFIVYGHETPASGVQWRARVEFQNGFAAEAPYLGTEARAVGTHSFTGPTGPEFGVAFVDHEIIAVVGPGGGVGAGPGRSIAALFRFEACALHQVVDSSGTPVRLPIGDTTGEGNLGGSRSGMTCDPEGFDYTEAIPRTDLSGYDFEVWTTRWTWDPDTGRLQEGASILAIMCCRSPDQDDVIFGFDTFECD